MPEGVRAIEPRIVRALSVLLVVAAGIRLLASLVAGSVEWQHATGPLFPAGRARAFDVLTTFGAAGDGTGVLLAVAAAVAVCWLSWRDDLFAARMRVTVSWLFGITAAMAVADGVGFGIAFSLDPGNQTSRLILTEGFALAYVVVAVGSIALLSRVAVLLDEPLATDEIDAFVFAVDRHTGDVRAFLSAREAARRMHLYSIEDDEFAFYTDEGNVLVASVVDERIVLQPTDQHQPAQLLEQLKDFVNRRGINVSPEEADDATAYVLPISRWHWLEMWPPWLRPIGMLLRPRVGYRS